MKSGFAEVLEVKQNSGRPQWRIEEFREPHLQEVTIGLEGWCYGGAVTFGSWICCRRRRGPAADILTNEHQQARRDWVFVAACGFIENPTLRVEGGGITTVQVDRRDDAE